MALPLSQQWLNEAETLFLSGRCSQAKDCLQLVYQHNKQRKEDDSFLSHYQRLLCCILHEEGQAQRALLIEAKLAQQATSFLTWKHDLTAYLHSLYKQSLTHSITQHKHTGWSKQAAVVEEVIRTFTAVLNSSAHTALHFQAQQSIAFAQQLLAKHIMHHCQHYTLIPHFPLTITTTSFSVSDIQTGYIQAFTLMQESTERWTRIGAHIQAISAILQHADALTSYAALFSTQPATPASSSLQTQPSSLAFPHLHKALTLYTEANQQLTEYLTSQLTESTDTRQVTASFVQQALGVVQRKISLLYLQLQRASQQEVVYTPSTDAATPTSTETSNTLGEVKTVAELEGYMMQSWIDKYDDVFVGATDPLTEPYPSLALSSVASSSVFHTNADTHNILGQTHLFFLRHHEAEQHRNQVKQEKAKRRAAEQEAWKKKVYGLDVIEAAEAERQRQEREAQEVIERERREEEAATQAAAALAEQERLKKEQEDKLAQEAGNKRNKGKVARSKEPNSLSLASSTSTVTISDMDPNETAAAQREFERQEAARVLQQQQDEAEDRMFAYDTSEWSPLHLLRWKRSFPRTKNHTSSPRKDEGDKKTTATDASKRDRVRQPSSGSLSIDEDEGLDPAILNDPTFSPASIQSIIHTHLITALHAALDQEEYHYSLIADSALGLVQLFTTHYPMLSIKYLSLYLSAKTATYAMNMFELISTESTEMLLWRKKQRLLMHKQQHQQQQHPASRTWQSQEEELSVMEIQPASTPSTTATTGTDAVLDAELRKVCAWLDDHSLLSSWCRMTCDLSSESPSDGNLPLQGYDFSYAQMLVSIPSSVILLTILYQADEHAIYVSVLSSSDFPISSRFSRTLLTFAQETSFQADLIFFQTFSDHLHTHLPSAYTAYSSQQLSSLESQYNTHIQSLSTLLQHCLIRADLKAPACFTDRDVIVLTDASMFSVPWESFIWLQGSRSVSRDFSLSSFNQRLMSSSAEPVNRDNVGYIVDSEGDDETQGLYAAFQVLRGQMQTQTSSWVGKHGAEGRVLPNDWLHAWLAGKDNGAFLSVGYASVFSHVNAHAFSALDIRGLRLAVLLDHTVNTSSLHRETQRQMEKTQVSRDMCSVYNTALLLSIRGVNSILCHQYSLSDSLSMSHVQIVSHCLANRQSIATVVKILQGLTDSRVIAMNAGDTAQDNTAANTTANATTTNINSQPTKTGSTSTPKHNTNGNASVLASPKNKGVKPSSIVTASANGAVSPKKSPTTTRAQQSPYNHIVRMYDRYNTILIGLPHWRM